MFDTVTKIDATSETDAPVAPFVPRRPADEEAGVREGGARYGAKPVNVPAAVAVALIHVALFGALFQMRTVYVQKKAASLAVVNLTPPPAPPPPSQEDTPPPTRPEVVAPRPIVQTPAPVTYQIPVVDKPSPVPVAQTPPAPPAPPPAPPAPSIVVSADLSTHMISGKPPRLPVESRRKREQGTVVLSLTLGFDGRVETVSIAKSSGYPRLDEAARDAARNWRWEPVVRNGEPVKVRGSYDVHFALQG